jgi:aminoglycoside phosphotransferase family enzyme/predicted kinase
MHKAGVGDQSAAIAFLSDPASYGPGIEKVVRHETHGAIVFLAGERAYKLKRAVRYPYMDYSTISLRRQMCEAELKVNRRTAPQIYLGVQPLVRSADGPLRFGSHDEDSKAVDWVIVMRRFAQDDLLEEKRKHGTLSRPLILALADAIAEFHARAEVTMAFGGAFGIRRVVDENDDVLRRFASRPFEVNAIERYTTEAHHHLGRVASLLEMRRFNGYVRRCHGDLHLNNICVIDGKPTLFDAIEFNEDFSVIDVFYDLAFLAMDLEHGRRRDLANALVNRYLEQTEDYGGLAALPLFLSCRAAMRAHVAATRADGGGTIKAELMQEATARLSEAIGFLAGEQPRLCVVSGLSGSGKSTLARELAPHIGIAPGAIVLRSDVIRKKLLGVREDERLPDEAYTAESNNRVYELIELRARTILKSGHSVIADAVYGREDERRSIELVARQSGATFWPIWLEAPAAVLEPRLAARRGDASDATIPVLRTQLSSVQKPRDWITIDAGSTKEHTLDEAIGVLTAKA